MEDKVRYWSGIFVSGRYVISMAQTGNRIGLWMERAKPSAKPFRYMYYL